MEQNEVILGVDTHLDTRVGAVISDTGRLLGALGIDRRSRPIRVADDPREGRFAQLTELAREVAVLRPR